MSAPEVRTEAGRWLDRQWPGAHIDRVQWHERVAAIEAEANATERARITERIQAHWLVEGPWEPMRKAVLAIVNGEASFDSPHDIAIKRGREM